MASETKDKCPYELFRTRTFKNLNATGLETRKGDG
jgi:hypothetical protein